MEQRYGRANDGSSQLHSDPSPEWTSVGADEGDDSIFLSAFSISFRFCLIVDFFDLSVMEVILMMLRMLQDMVDWLVVVVNRIHNDLMKLIVSII